MAKMFEALLAKAGIAYVLYGALMATGVFTRAARYDYKLLKKQRVIAAHPSTRRLRSRPLVSIIVTAHGQPMPVLSSLESIAQSSYRNWEAVILDETTGNGVKQAVMSYAAEHPGQAIKLVARRSRSKSPLLAGRRYVYGELLLAINAGMLLEKNTLMRARQQFAFDDKLQTLILETRYAPSPPSIMQLVKQTKLLATTYLAKCGIRGQTAMLVRRGAAVGRKSTLERLIGWNRFMLPLAPAFTTYFAYVAINLKNTGPYALAWALVSAILVFGVVWDTSLRWLEKIRLLLFVPVMYGLLYVLSIAYGLLRIKRAFLSLYNAFKQRVPTLASNLKHSQQALGAKK